jgi:hypothetical protein
VEILVFICLLIVGLGAPYLIYTASSNRSCRGSVVGGCLGPVMGYFFCFLLILFEKSEHAPYYGVILLLPIFIGIGAIVGAIIGALGWVKKD